MLDYIKSRLAENEALKSKAKDNSVEENSLILEYSHLFQELDDLTEKGTDDEKDRKMSVDIPLDDDIELESIEVNLTDGRITDIPMDASVQESQTYDMMHTYDDFYQEALTNTSVFPRETEDAYYKRVERKAKNAFAQYEAHVIQEGLFGFDKISIEDNKVPSKVIVDFGPLRDDSSQHYFVKLPVKFMVDKNRDIRKKQLDSVNRAVTHNVFEGSKTAIRSLIVDKKYNNIPENKNIWDVFTPKCLKVPVEPVDKFCVIVEFDSDISGKVEGLKWVKPTKDNKFTTKSSDEIGITANDTPPAMAAAMDASAVSKDDVMQSASPNPIEPDRAGAVPSDNISPDEDLKALSPEEMGFSPVEEPETANATEDSAGSVGYVNKDEAIKEYAEVFNRKRRRKLDRFARYEDDYYYQEAIDFGDADTTGDDIPPADDAGDNTDEPSVEMGDSGEGDGEKETIDTNDVSDQIAEKISNNLNDDGEVDDLGTAPADTDDDLDNLDLGDAPQDGTTDDMADQKFDELNDAGTDDMDKSDDMADGNIDFENMTIDQLMEQGSERLRGMTISQLKDFLQMNDDDAIQEAFILTKRNIDKEFNSQMRKTLGILNDNTITAEKILKKFKFEGKKLNRILSKAGKMNGHYSEQEIKQINALNKDLTDLMLSIKANPHDPSIKDKIKKYIGSCNEASKMLNVKLTPGTTPTSAGIEPVSSPKTAPTEEDVTTESYYREDSWTAEDDVFMEALFTNKKNVYNRLALQLDNCVNDFKYISDKIKSGDITDKVKLEKAYFRQTETSRSIGTDGSDLTTNTTVKYGEKAPADRIGSLIHILKIAAKARRTESAFTVEERNKVLKYYEDVKAYDDTIRNICQKKFINKEYSVNNSIKTVQNLSSKLYVAGNAIREMITKKANATGGDTNGEKAKAANIAKTEPAIAGNNK